MLAIEAVQESDMCVTMGCGDARPRLPGKPEIASAGAIA
jgi:hypothetical protein